MPYYLLLVRNIENAEDSDDMEETIEEAIDKVDELLETNHFITLIDDSMEEYGSWLVRMSHLEAVKLNRLQTNVYAKKYTENENKK